MVTCLDRTRLEISQGGSLEARMRNISFELQVEEKAHDNKAEFKRLEEEDERLTAAYTAAGGAFFIALTSPEPVTKVASFAAGTATASFVLKRTQKINNILRNGKRLDKEFGDQEIQITVDIPVPDNGELDLFVKFPLPPRKAIFAIALRSQGEGVVFYNEKKEALYIRTGGGGLKLWKPDHIERLGLQEFWLRKNRQQELFGTSSRDKNRSAVKLLVLTGETKVGQHSDSLYTQVGDQRILLIRRRASIYVMRESQLIPFIRAWIAPTEQESVE